MLVRIARIFAVPREPGHSNGVTGFELHWTSLVASGVMSFPHGSQCCGGEARRAALSFCRQRLCRHARVFGFCLAYLLLLSLVLFTW